MNYGYWKAALAGEKPKMFVDDPQCGFYRRGVYEKQENKARKRVGWAPVAIYLMNGTDLVAAVGGRTESDRDKINELWSYCAAYPISEETYRAVAERGEGWPDSHETVASIPVANSSGAVNQEASFQTIVIKEIKPSPIHERIAAQIDDDAKLLPKFAAIDSDEQSSKARSLQQKFLDLRGEAKKNYDALNEPLLAEQKRIRSIWFPIRDKAEDAASQLREAMSKWEDVKRKAARDAAERAEAGQEARSNVPPPSSQIRGGAGRAASVSVAVFVTSIDEDKVFQQFKGNPELTALLTALAQKAIRAGIPVPGAVTEERSVVR